MSLCAHGRTHGATGAPRMCLAQSRCFTGQHGIARAGISAGPAATPRSCLKPHASRQLPARPELQTSRRTSAVVHAARGGAEPGSSGYNTVSSINLAANKELRASRTLDDLMDTYQSYYDHLDAVNVATAWHRLRHLYRAAPPVSQSSSHMWLGACKRLLPKTLALVPIMGVQAVANTVSAIGTLRVRLDTLDNGHYLAEVLQERLLELAAPEGSLKEVLDYDQVWFGLSNLMYDWDRQFMSSLTAATLRDMQKWSEEDSSFAGVANVALDMVKCANLLSFHLSTEQKAQLAAAMERMVQSPHIDSMIRARTAHKFFLAAHELGLPLGASTVTTLGDAARQLAPSDLMDGGTIRRNDIISSLYFACKLGYAPSASHMAEWTALLTDGFQPKQTNAVRDVVQLMSALRAMPGYKPNKHMQQQFLSWAAWAACSTQLRAKEAKQLVITCQAWGLQLPQHDWQRLKQLASSSM